MLRYIVNTLLHCFWLFPQPARIQAIVSTLSHGWRIYSAFRSARDFQAGSADRRICGPRLFRVFSVAIITKVPYSIAVSELRRPFLFLSHRYFFIAGGA
jgi:hypothetical protein